MPKILDGAAIAAQIKQEVAEEVKRLATQGVRPGLAAVLVGHVPASEIYVRNKVQTCAELGLFSELITPHDTVTTEALTTDDERTTVRTRLIELFDLFDPADPGVIAGRRNLANALY